MGSPADESFEFKDWIRQLREKAGKTQDEVARDVRVQKRAVERWESGDATPRGQNFLLLLSSLGIDPGVPNAPRAISEEVRLLRSELAATRKAIERRLQEVLAGQRPPAMRQGGTETGQQKQTGS